MKRWIFWLDVESAGKPGLVARVAHVFAERGLSLDELLATTFEGRPLLLLRFAASKSTRDYLARRLARIEAVQVVDFRADDDRPIWAHLEGYQSSSSSGFGDPPCSP